MSWIGLLQPDVCEVHLSHGIGQAHQHVQLHQNEVLDVLKSKFDLINSIESIELIELIRIASNQIDCRNFKLFRPELSQNWTKNGHFFTFFHLQVCHTLMGQLRRVNFDMVYFHRDYFDRVYFDGDYFDRVYFDNLLWQPTSTTYY